jgi:hypothetical protein
MTTPSIPTQAELDKQTKASLQAKYKEVLGSDPDESLTKAALATAILEKLEQPASGGDGAESGNDNSGDQSGNDGAAEADKGNDAGNNPPPPATPSIPTQAGVLKLVRMEDGKVTDRTTMNKSTWEHLPKHKYGWQIEKPTELS